jgi:predicted ATPase
VWVPLAALTDPALVLTSVGRAVGVPGAEGLDPREAVAERLRGRRVLLVVDNVEHVLDAAADLGDLLERCPDLVVLATSRAALRLRAEREVPVPPLGLPGGERVADSAAVALFVERAAAVSPGFALTAENASDVAEVCRRLAGIPLALELAAAKVRLLEPGALLDRLDAAMRTGGARDLPARQRTMQATLDWSHDLLGPAEQGLLRRLSVSRGGVDLELAEALGGPGSDVVAGLERLVEHSLLHVRTGPTGALRYEMLEPVLQYARARLTDPQESREVRLAHVHHMLSRAEAAVPDYRRATAVTALARTGGRRGQPHRRDRVRPRAGRGRPRRPHGWALWLYWWLRGPAALGDGSWRRSSPAVPLRRSRLRRPRRRRDGLRAGRRRRDGRPLGRRRRHRPRLGDLQGRPTAQRATAWWRWPPATSDAAERGLPRRHPARRARRRGRPVAVDPRATSGWGPSRSCGAAGRRRSSSSRPVCGRRGGG